MKALIQRVKKAQVDVDNQCIGAIEQGILALIGLEQNDSQQHIEKMVAKLLNYRIFADSDDKMNLSVKDIEGGLLLVPQFTLAADTRKGLRPSFSSSMHPSDAKPMFEHFVSIARQQYSKIETGQFGADMQVSLVNDGPVTFMLEL